MINRRKRHKDAFLCAWPSNRSYKSFKTLSTVCEHRQVGICFRSPVKTIYISFGLLAGSITDRHGFAFGLRYKSRKEKLEGIIDVQDLGWSLTMYWLNNREPMIQIFWMFMRKFKIII